MSDFVIDIDLALPGRSAKPPSAEFVRDLLPADMAVRRDEPLKAPPIKRLRDSHHALAKALASGLKPAECQLLTGYSASRISILQADPAFKELLEFYREKAEGERDVVVDRFTNFMMDNLSVLEEKLEDAPEKVTPAEARENIKMAAGIAGFSGINRNLNVNMNIDIAGRLADARKRASMASGLDAPGRLIEAQALAPRPAEQPSAGTGSSAAPVPATKEEVE